MRVDNDIYFFVFVFDIKSGIYILKTIRSVRRKLDIVTTVKNSLTYRYWKAEGAKEDIRLRANNILPYLHNLVDLDNHMGISWVSNLPG